MAITYKSLKRIKFPIYPIDIDEVSLQDGILFYKGDKVLDDTNMKGETLGARRLQSPFNDRLYPLRKGIANIVGLSKNKYKYYIDSEGKLFEYEKTVFCQIKYLRIVKVERKGTASLLYVDGIPRPFTIPRPPEQGMHWAIVLHLKGLPWMLYGYSGTKEPDSIRKI